jgi:hypothetical protein
MDAGSWFSRIGYAGRLFVESIPDASWLAYSWAKDWQGLLGGLFLLCAAWIFSQSSLRAARIRAAAMVRSAEIAARAGMHADLPPASAQAAIRVEPAARHPVSPENTLTQKVEQLRSLIRSAMSTLTSDAGTLGSMPNFYCERIALLKFEDGSLPANLSPLARDLHKKLALQLAVVRQAAEKKAPQAELSECLVQLNARARELATALSPAAPASVDMGPARR